MKTHQGYLVGPRIDATELYGICLHQWKDPGVALGAAAISLSECNGFTKARCENFVDGKLVSADYGLFQLNYQADAITPALLQRLYDPVENARLAYSLWKRRGWQPWHGYTNNIALNPEMRGKYIQRALWGQMNYYRKQYGMKGVPSPYITLGPRRLTWWLEHPELKS